MSGQDYWTSPRTIEEIENTAQAWRYALCVDDEAAPDLLSILENKLPRIEPAFSIRIIESPLPNRVPAMASFHPPEIWMTEDTYQGAIKWARRHRFTLAHELGHIVLHSGQSIGRASNRRLGTTIPATRSSEWQANKFAAAFLMPPHIVKYYKVPLACADGTLVSVEAAEIRMRELGLWGRNNR